MIKLAKTGTVAGIGDYGYRLATGERLVGLDFSYESDSSDANPIYGLNVPDSAEDIVIEQCTFQGTAVADKDTNLYSAILVGQNTKRLVIRHCEFFDCTPVSWTSSSGAQVTFENNVCHDLPNAVSLPSDATVTGNVFENASVLTTRSHGLYLFGLANDAYVAGNIFRRIDKMGIKFRTGAGTVKRGIRIIGNLFDECGETGIGIGADTAVPHRDCTIVGNVFRNCKQALQGFAIQHSVVSDNQVSWDANCPFVGCRGIYVGSPGLGQFGNVNVAKNCVVRGNQIFSTAGAGVVQEGIQVEVAFNVDVIGNHIEGVPSPIVNTYAYKTRIIGNKVIDWKDEDLQYAGILSQGSVDCTYYDNEFVEVTAMPDDRYLETLDGFPRIDRNPDVVGAQKGVELPTDPTKTYLWFGREWALGQAQSETLPFRWNDGDTVDVNGYTATFKRTTPGANEFNDRDGLISLINANVGGVTADKDPDTVNFPAYGYIRMTNSPTISVTTASKICGVLA